MYCINCGAQNEEDYEFCIQCGAKISNVEPPVQEPAKPETDPEPAVVSPTIEDTAPRKIEPPIASPTEQKQKTIKNRSLKKIPSWAIGVLGILIIAIFGVLILLRGSSFFSALLGPSDQLVFLVQETNASDPISAVMSIQANGRDYNEIYSDPDGFTLAFDYFNNSLSGQGPHISPDKNILVVQEVKNRNFVFIPLNGEDATLVDYASDDDGNTVLPVGFSPDGELYVYSLLGNEFQYDATLHVLDRNGDEVQSYSGAYRGSFIDNKHMLIESIEPMSDSFSEYVANLSILNIESGEIDNSLTDFNLSVDYGILGGLFSSPNGNSAYYSDDEGLNKVSIRGGDVENIYDSAGTVQGFATKNGNYMVLLDIDNQNYGNGTADLYTLDAKKLKKVRIDKYVRYYQSTYGYPHASIRTSPDEKYLAYITLDENNSTELNISQFSGEGKLRLSSGASWYRYTFSPDKKRIAYIEGYSENSGGRLVISELSGKNKVRLDDNVWSFQFTGNGKYIAYTKVEDLNRSRPESEIWRIRVDGKQKKILHDVEDGLFTFVMSPN